MPKLSPGYLFLILFWVQNSSAIDLEKCKKDIATFVQSDEGPAMEDEFKLGKWVPELGIDDLSLIKLGQRLTHEGSLWEVVTDGTGQGEDMAIGLRNLARPDETLEIPVSQKKLDPEKIHEIDQITHQKALAIGKIHSVRLEAQYVEALADSFRARGYVVSVESVPGELGAEGAKRLRIVRAPSGSKDILGKVISLLKAPRYRLDGVVVEDSGSSFVVDPSTASAKGFNGLSSFEERKVVMGAEWSEYFAQVLGLLDIHEVLHHTLDRAVHVNPRVKPEQAQRVIAFYAHEGGVLPGAPADKLTLEALFARFPEVRAEYLKMYLKMQGEDYYSGYRMTNETDVRIAEAAAVLNALSNPARLIPKKDPVTGRYDVKSFNIEINEERAREALVEAMILSFSDVKNIDHVLAAMDANTLTYEAKFLYEEANQVKAGYANLTVVLEVQASPGASPPAPKYQVRVPGFTLSKGSEEPQEKFELRVQETISGIKEKDPDYLGPAVDFAKSQLRNLRQVRASMVVEFATVIREKRDILDAVSRIRKKQQELRKHKYTGPKIEFPLPELRADTSGPVVTLRYPVPVRGVQEISRGRSNVGQFFQITFNKRNPQETVTVEGFAIDEYGAGIDLVDADGAVHSFNGNMGTFASIKGKGGFGEWKKLSSTDGPGELVGKHVIYKPSFGKVVIGRVSEELRDGRKVLVVREAGTAHLLDLEKVRDDFRQSLFVSEMTPEQYRKHPLYRSPTAPEANPSAKSYWKGFKNSFNDWKSGRSLDPRLANFQGLKGREGTSYMEAGQAYGSVRNRNDAPILILDINLIDTLPGETVLTDVHGRKRRAKNVRRKNLNNVPEYWGFLGPKTPGARNTWTQPGYNPTTLKNLAVLGVSPEDLTGKTQAEIRSIIDRAFAQKVRKSRTGPRDQVLHTDLLGPDATEAEKKATDKRFLELSKLKEDLKKDLARN